MELVFTRTFHFCQNVTVERHPRLQFPNIFLKDLVSFLYTKQINADFFQPTINFTEPIQRPWLRGCMCVCHSPGALVLCQGGPRSVQGDEQRLGPGREGILTKPSPRNEAGRWKLT